MTCPLCFKKEDLSPVQGPDKREYCCCNHCKLVFVADPDLPSPAEEKSRYLKHENTIANEGYVEFLSRAIKVAEPYLGKGILILDYGCGPNPVLSQILDRRGFPVVNYDPYFFPAMQEAKYDMIFAIEVLEHFFRPAIEIKKIHSLLNDGGYFIIMTQQWENLSSFSNWSYARDFTHTRFYHAKSFAYIAKHFGFDLRETNSPGVIVLQKSIEISAS